MKKQEQELQDFIIDEKELKAYSANTITPKDFDIIVESISGILRYCNIESLRQIFISAMDAQGAKQNMEQFEPMCINYIDLFIRQITSAAKMVDYDTLVDLYNNIVEIALKDNSIEEE